MRMKNSILLIFVLFVIFFLTSCKLNDPSLETTVNMSLSTTQETTMPVEQTDPRTSNVVSEAVKNLIFSGSSEGAMKKVLSEIENVASNEVRTYSLDDFDAVLNMLAGDSLQEPVHVMHVFNEKWPITNLKAVDDNTVYTVYTVEKDGKACRAYFFFRSTVTSEETENWTLTNQNIFMCKTLSCSDFSGLSVGSTLTQVGEIDPAVVFHNMGGRNFTSLHLLTDGILTITYTRESEGDIPKVTDISFDKDFTVKSFSSDATYNFRIDPEDYVNY